MNRQRGAAMILVLMVTGILGLLMLQVSLTAREHVARAQLLSDRADAELSAQSRESALLFTLLTEAWVEQSASHNPYAAAWNFHGKPFTVDGVTYVFQDVSGLLPVSSTSPGRFVALLNSLGVDAPRATRLGEQLMALQGVWTGPLRPRGVEPSGSLGPMPVGPPGVPGHFPVQSLAELRGLADMDEDLFRRLEPLLTLYPVPGFNPMTAPPEVLRTQVSPTTADGLLQLRERRLLDQGSLWAVAGITADDLTTVYPGPAIRIDMLLEHHGVSVRRRSTVVLRPYTPEPVAVWSRREAGGAGA